MRRFKGEFAHFSFNKCLIYSHDGASAKLSTNSHETDNSVERQVKVLIKNLASFFLYPSKQFLPISLKIQLYFKRI